MKYTKYSAIIVSLLFSTLLTGCKFAITDPKGIIATQEMDLIIVAVLLMLIIVIPVFIMTAFFAWHYRAGNTKAMYTPEWSESTLFEVLCWMIPCLIIGALATITWIAAHRLDPYRPLISPIKPINIQAVALDWKWLFIYPDQHIATVNYVVFPVHTPINFQITADAPMNSLWIPQLSGQIYAMTGMVTQLHMNATESGNYRGMSSNFSGPGFSDMHFIAHATSGQEFAQWVETVKHANKVLDNTEYTQLAKQSDNNPVTYYSSVTDNLFTTIVNSFMLPKGESTGAVNNSMNSM